jgi:DNA-binding cell septation regulator SpoVG
MVKSARSQSDVALEAVAVLDWTILVKCLGHCLGNRALFVADPSRACRAHAWPMLCNHFVPLFLLLHGR